jgi:hypothetical protein
MQFTRLGSAVRRGIAAVLLVTQVACLTAPRAVESPAPYLRASTPKRIWVSLTDGQQMVIDGPRVYGDTLLGFTLTDGQPAEVWLPLERLQEVKTRRISGAKTALLGLSIVTGVVLFATMVKGGGAFDNPCMNEGEPCTG